MSEKIISALPGSAKSTVSSTPKPTLYRSKKKLRMETHYFNTTPLPISMAHESRRSPIKKVKTAETLTFPTSEYTTNSNAWFRHVFGIDSDNGPTQHSFAPYGGKVCSGRPNHYDASKSGKTVPTNLQEFSVLYCHDSDDGDTHVGNVNRNPTSFSENLGLQPTHSDKQKTPSRDSIKRKSASSAMQTEIKTKKRSIPQEFISEQDRQRGQSRARIEENWEFGRALAKKHIENFSKNTATTEKRGKAGETETAQEPREKRMEARMGNKQLYQARGKNSSFMILQMNVVTLGEDLLEVPSPA